MRQVIGIRCNRVGEPESSMRNYLLSYFKSEDIYYLIDNRNNHSSNSLPAILLTQDSISKMSLLPVDDWGWRCGDYFYYSFRNNVVSDYYWLVEPDVGFSLIDPTFFFEKCKSLKHDFFGVFYGPRDSTWSWYPSICEFNSSVYGCTFAFSRLSAQAIDYLMKARIMLSQKNSNNINTVWANDEAFVSTAVANSNFLSAIDLRDEFKGYFSKFGTKDQYLIDSLPLGSGIIHPVLPWDDYRIKFKKRYDASLRNNRLDLFLRNSLVGLSSLQIDELIGVK
jgi:hypothetical protein